MECKEQRRQTELRSAWDRLVLVLLSEPRAGYEDAYKEAAGRELSRLAALCVEEGARDE